MTKDQILTHDYRLICFKRIIIRKKVDFIRSLGMTLDDFVDHVVADSWILVKGNNNFKMSTIAVYNTDWCLYKLYREYSGQKNTSYLFDKENIKRAIFAKDENKNTIDLSPLRGKELDIVQYMLLGYTIKEIAYIMDISRTTISKYYKEAIKKLRKDLTGCPEMLESGCPVTHSSEKENDRCREDASI